MTFDDDHVRLQFPFGPRDMTCKRLGCEWPPPQFILIGSIMFNRIRYSGITDEQRAEMTNVVRGAEYVPVDMDGEQEREAFVIKKQEQKSNE